MSFDLYALHISIDPAVLVALVQLVPMLVQWQRRRAGQPGKPPGSTPPPL